MTDTANPFVHPAQQRLLEMIDQAEAEILQEQENEPLHDPLRKFHTAREWGVDPWVAAMLPVSQHLDILQNLAVGIAPDPEVAVSSLMAVVKHSLQAMVLFDEDIMGEEALDDQQLAEFLDRLVSQLDARIDRLREPKAKDRDDEISPGLAFTEGFDDTHPSDALPDSAPIIGPHDEHDGWLNHADELSHAHDGHTGLHVHEGWNLVVWTPGSEPFDPAQVAGHDDPEFMEDYTSQIREERGGRLVPDEEPGPSKVKDLIRPEEIDPAQAKQSHDFRPEVDLDAAERALAREAAHLRRSAAGSTAGQVVGRHASPDDTQPDMGDTGRRAKEN